MTTITSIERSMPISAECVAQGVHFRVFASQAQRVEVVFDDGTLPLSLTAEGDGYFSGLSTTSSHGTLYRFCLDGGEPLHDPASRFQPDGVHGSSQVIEPARFAWTDQAWRGVPSSGQILYEMHVGTFTREGTYASAIQKLLTLKELGVTCVELMPVNEFAGRWGWGYDGVDQFAPFHHYGSPDDLRHFIDRAHALGIGVILDVVYNHFGPDGNVLPMFSEDYFSKEHHSDWGDALNFDGENNEPVREFFLANALYWIREFHFDGFRFDATQAIPDESSKHILAEMTEKCRAFAEPRQLYIINENEPQNTQLVRPLAEGGYGMDALWNDDFHHCAMSLLSGHNEAYYIDHPGTPQEFISSAKWGYLFQGQRYAWHKSRRGTPALDLPPTSFVHFLQNHDQIANSARGLRAHQLASPSQMRAMTTLLLLMPQTPLLFQGQEWAASSPFNYFTDHHDELATLIAQGRAKEVSQFPSAASCEMQANLIDPRGEATFRRCQLNWEEFRQPLHQQWFQLHQDLIAMRRNESVFARVQRRGDIDGAVLGPSAFVLRFFGEADHCLLLVVNYGQDLLLTPCPEPLLAPPQGKRWSQLFSSEDPKYGGCGSPPTDTEDEGWYLHGRCAMVLEPKPASQAAVKTRLVCEGSKQDLKKRPKDESRS